MKRLHRMIIGAYWGPLVVTTLIVLFIMVMQFLWLYVDDLMGKGLPWYTLVELMMYATAHLVPEALPLGVLLSSIMTMGALGENRELIPMRSAGLGLFRILRPLMVFVLLMSGFSFFFSNNLLPIANLKFQSLLYDVTHKKPSLSLPPGVFYNGIDGFSIRVKEKNDRTSELTDVLIYDHRQSFQGNRTVLRAKRGRMRRSTDDRYLVLTLQDGVFYDERNPGGDTRGDFPLVRGTFEQDEVRLDLSGMGLDRTNEDLFKDHYKMMTLGQLDQAMDTLRQRHDQAHLRQQGYLRNALFITRDSAVAGKPGAYADMHAFTERLTPQLRANLYDIASNMVRNSINYLDRTLEENDHEAEQIARYKVEWHRKLMLATACLVFFFIGAPLGAIIRKGGMGMPTLFAIIFFLIFRILSYSTERLVIAGKLEAWPGMWISTMVLLPVGLWLTWIAATDSPLLERDAYVRGWQRLRARLRPA